MKAKFYLVSFIVIAAICSSCGSSIEPTEKDLKNYITALSHYYPYSIHDDFIFENDSLGEKWENKPFTYSSDSIYPETEIWLCNELGASCYGDRSASIDSYFIENGVSRYSYSPSQVSTSINKGGSPDVHLSWYIYLSFGAYDYYRGHYNVTCAPSEVLSQLTDTIIIPIQRQGTTSGEITIPDGAYARIIKDIGLTDFTLDGRTYWKRVKE